MTYTPKIFAAAGTLLVTGQETFPRQIASSNTNLSSGNMRTTVFRARKTETTTQVRFSVGQAAAGGSTGVSSAYVGLYTVASDGALTRVAVTGDIKTSLTSTGQKTVSWTSSYDVVAGTLLAVGIGATYDSTTAPALYTALSAGQGESAASMPPLAMLLALSAGSPAASYSAATVIANTTTAAPYFVILPA